MGKTFGLIRDINPEDESSWRNKIFLTLDIDWASDEVLEYVYEKLVDFKVPATWFATHETPVNRRIEKNNNFEIGIHPNFNPLLLEGSFVKGKTAKEVLENTLNLVSSSTCVRSHSLTQNSTLLLYFVSAGLKYDLNTLIPFNSGINVRPYRHCTGIIQLPHIWEDDVHCMYKWDYADTLNYLLTYDGLAILDFHPIHLFLNTENLKRYEESRPFQNDIQKLVSYKFDGYGTENFLFDILNEFSKD